MLSRLLTFLAVFLFFHILVFSQASVTISSPSGSEEVKFGETLDISWENGDLAGNDRFFLYYSNDGGTFTSIDAPFHSQLTNDGNNSTYSWTIPDFGADSASQFRIRVFNQAQNVADTSVEFRVYWEPDVDIILPDGSEEVKFGETLKISWLNGDLIGNDRFYLYYSNDGGSFTHIDSPHHSQLTNSGDTSTYSWTIPDFGADSASQFRIRVLNQNRTVSDTSVEYRVYWEPEVDLILPDGSEEVKFGETLNISWLNGDLIGNDRFYLYYSNDGGAFTYINAPYHSQLTNSGDTSTYIWTIPDFGADSSSQFRIRVLNQNRTVSDTSVEYRVYWEPEVDLILPDGSEEVKFGETLNISWVNGDMIGNDRFYLYYSNDGGAYTYINAPYHSQLTNSGDTSTYSWTIPDFGADSASQFRIRVLNQNRTVSDTSVEYRVYWEPEVDIIKPAAGDFVLQGSTQQISWINNDMIGNDRFYLYYSVDGGAFTYIGAPYYSQLAKNGETVVYNWTTPTIVNPNASAKIRVLNQNRTVADTTLSFVLCSECPALALYYPNGGELLGAGKTVEIGWSLAESTTWTATDEILIEFSQDGGTTYESTPIYSGQYSAISDNKVNWIVPNILTTQGIVRVSNTTQEVSDESNNVFTIATPPAEPTDFFALENANGTITFSWTDNADNETNYQIQYSSDNVNWANYTGLLAADTETHTTGFIGNAGYWWRLVVSSSGLNGYSNSRYAGNIAPPGNALSFDGTDDKIALDSVAAFNFGTQDFTIETWFNVSDLSNSRVIISDFNGTVAGSMGLYIQSNGAVAAFIGSNTPDLTTSEGAVTTDKWYHLALVRSEDEAFIYLNGVMSASSSGLASRNLQSAVPMTIGQQPSGSSFYFAGAIDEVRFWKEARTSVDLTDNMLIELNGNEPNLLSYYRFDQSGSSAVLPDRTINNIGGTWSGAGGSNTSPSWISSGAFTDPGPAMSILTPGGGELLNVGEQFNITWQATNFISSDSVKISLSADNGQSYALIAKGLVEEMPGSYNWTVPDSVTTSARIAVANTTQSVSDTTATFRIQQVTLNVTTPNGGEFWEVGTNQTISWISQGFINTDEIEISLSVDSGDTYAIISEGLHNTYSGSQLVYTVPDSVSETALIKIENTTRGISDVSDSLFVIGTVERNVAILYPNGGESFAQETQVEVTFEVEGIRATDGITFTLSVDNGESFPYTLAQGAMSAFPDSSFTWTVSQPISDQVLIRANVANYALADTSDATFSIVEAPAAPVFGVLDVEIVGDQYNLTYSMDEPGSVYMVILADGSNLPNATQVKNAGETSLPGQVAFATYEYSSAEDTMMESGAAIFSRQSIYDVYFTAEDDEGNLNAGVSRPNVFAQFSPLELDSLVVQQMYNNMSGENWNVEEGWSELPLESRTEIVVEDSRITQMNFSDKGLTGSLPVDILNMDSLNTLILSGNNITTIPDLSGMISLQTISVANNSLDFGDLEPNASLFDESSEYSPQSNLGESDSLTYPKGSEYSFNVVVGGEQNTYQWKRDNYNTFEKTFVDIDGATSASFLVEDLDFDNMGTYYVEVQNPLLPGLVIQSQPVQLWATSDLKITILADEELVAEGSAYALRNRGPGLAYDSIPRDPSGLTFVNGNVLFDDLLLGQYLIAIRSDPTKYLPTYYENTYLWEEADLLDFKGNLSDTMKMFVIPPPLGPDDGSGTLAGGVETDFEDEDGGGRIDARRKVKRAGCSIRRFTRGGRTDQEDGEFVLVAYVESDEEGRFRIENIPGGLYRFNIEYPGIPMDPDSYVEFEIGEEGSTNNTIELQATITEDGIFVERTNFLGFGRAAKDLVDIYPNPADSELKVRYPDQFAGYLVKLISSEGKVISVTRFTSDASCVLKINTTSLPDGQYFLNIVDDTNRAVAISLRVVVKH